MAWTLYSSPVGEVVLAADQSSLWRLTFNNQWRPDGPRDDDHPVLAMAVAELSAYFAGELTEFTVPLRLEGSEFERRVWQRLRAIPYGETRTYGQIAAELGDPKAARAVGLANNHNPIAIIVPCHRVIGANGSLVGYGGGLDNKRLLLELEARVAIERSFTDW